MFEQKYIILPVVKDVYFLCSFCLYAFSLVCELKNKICLDNFAKL